MRGGNREVVGGEKGEICVEVGEKRGEERQPRKQQPQQLACASGEMLAVWREGLEALKSEIEELDSTNEGRRGFDVLFAQLRVSE